jgi:hypothetical protein
MRSEYIGVSIPIHELNCATVFKILPFRRRKKTS